jgi:Zn finger protein HypA/HybF involved in hydrogenase expression
MREFDLTQKLLDAALKNADSRRIVRVNLLIGPFCDEREDSIRSFWRDLAKGTPGEGAQLYFEHMQVESKCFACGGSFYSDGEGSLCVYCQSDRLHRLNGQEVQLESVDLE